MEHILDHIALAPPATSTIKCNISASTINKLSGKLEELRTILSSNKVMNIEMDLVNRLVYSNTNRLRLDKGFQYFRNIKRFYNKYKFIKVKSALVTLKSCLPEHLFGSCFYMPTRQMLQYLLHQIIITVTLLEKIVFYSQRSGFFFIERIRVGHSWSMASVFLAVCSRVSYICRRLSWQCCMIYNEIAPFLPYLILSGPDWTEKGFKFPKQLEEVLDIKNPLKLRQDIEAEQNEKPQIFKLLIDLDGNDADEVQLQFYEEKINSQATVQDDTEVIIHEVQPVDPEDIGEVIETVVSISTKRKRKRRKPNVDVAVEVIDIIDHCDAGNKFTKKIKLGVDDTKNARQVVTEFMGSMEEKIDGIDSLAALSAFLNQEVSNASASEKHSTLRRQLGGILSALKKKKMQSIESTKLLIRAKDLLRSTLL